MGSETLAITDRVPKQIVTIFSKTCNNAFSNPLFDISLVNQNSHAIYVP